MSQKIPEETLLLWSRGPSATESAKAENAERIICDALNADTALAKLNIKVFAQGSYHVRTNVRQDSDVDICVLAKDFLYCEYPAGYTQADYGIYDVSYSFKEFKNEVELALTRRFGKLGVTRGNKAIDIHANTYRIDADVVAAFEHRRYIGGTQANPNFLSGTQFFADDGGKVINWPEQTYQNGIYKNNSTSRRYKRVIRILKRLRNRMQEEDITKAKDIGSFLIESLVWNVPEQAFASALYTDNVRAVLANIIANTGSQDKCSEWGEVNGLKYLFRPSQPWSRQQAYDFALAAWIHLGLS